MYGNGKEKRRNWLQSATLWPPLILLLALFLFGACARTGESCAAQTAAISSLAAEQARSESFSGIESSSGALRDTEFYSDSGRGYSELGESASGPEGAFADPAGAAGSPSEFSGGAETKADSSAVTVSETGNYSSKEEVALYLHRFGRLPSNYITKAEAERRGWDPGKGNLEEILPGMSIGGSLFGNYEGLLPSGKGRRYYECDIGYEGGYRNAKRIVYSNDGLIFYTEDHYKSFERLY